MDTTPSLSTNVSPILNRVPVDIIIPFHGHYESVAKCIVNIQEFTPNQKYNIYLVDDCSPNSSFIGDVTANKKKTFGIRLDQQRGFGAAVNAGIVAGNNPNIVVMHSDAHPNNINWLGSLQRSLAQARNQGIKLVSSRVNNPGTTNDYPQELINDDKAEAEFVEATKPLPLICAMFHRELINRVGLLKEYPYGWYEDTEFYYRMKLHGYKQGIAMKSVVHHDGGKTISSMINDKPSIKKVMESNAQLCRNDISKLKETLGANPGGP
jgi:GT2 family glycosyltransferase